MTLILISIKPPKVSDSLLATRHLWTPKVAFIDGSRDPK